MDDFSSLVQNLQYQIAKGHLYNLDNDEFYENIHLGYDAFGRLELQLTNLILDSLFPILCDLPINSLIMKYCACYEFSNGFFERCPLVFFYIYGCQIDHFQPLESVHPTLGEMWISSCEIKQPLNQFEMMPHLTKLVYSNAQLEEIPSSVSTLSCLSTFMAYGNNIRSMNLLCNNRALQFISLTNNKIDSLPSDLELIPYLKRLDLSENRIKVIPENISELRYLEQFRLDHNRLTALPIELYALPLLSTLEVQMNPLLTFNPHNIPMQLLLYLTLSKEALKGQGFDFDLYPMLTESGGLEVI
ncbi:leucine-rich repeat domain-containing protein [Candidatus Lokiarchaeum ossiferum]|uniref:leucine-rich repeat domain-containing protein n=1 Tax=Candidatus Lokiarchaeum ossiferum TaxID=2951803 RepID=UPI00352E2ED8